MRKVLSTMLALVFAVTMLQIGGITASAADSDFTYGLNYNKTGMIIQYTGSATDVVIPSQLGGTPITEISSMAFYGCNIMTSLTIPDGLSTIATSSFYGCTNLTNFIVGSGNPYFSVQDGVLFNKEKTKLIKYPPNKSGSYSIPSSVNTIESEAFNDCTGLTTIDIPASVTDFSYSYFMGCKSLTQINVDASNPNYASVDGVLFDKSISYIIQFPAARSGSYTIPNSVTYIFKSAFGFCAGLTNITIPTSVTNIVGNAFYGCSGLTSINIPDSVTSVDVYSFYNCTALKSISIGKGAANLAPYAFIGCPALTQFTVSADNPSYSSQDGVLFNKYKTSIICYPFAKSGYYSIPPSVTSIVDQAFYGCTALTGLTIPSSITAIGKYTFYGCTSLTTVSLPNTLTSIGAVSFTNCSSLSSVTIPASVTSIQARAFTGCKALKEFIVNPNNSNYSVQDGVLFNIDKTELVKYPDGKSGNSFSIPNSVKYIDSYAFEGNNGLTGITITDSVINIGSYAFNGCTGLSSINIPNSVTGVGHDLFGNCTSLVNAVLGSGITEISNNLFSGCTALKSVTIPNSVTTIGSDAFFGCTGLTGVTIPNNVTTIGSDAFLGCTKLSRIIIPTSVTQIKNAAFSGCSSLVSACFMGNAPSILGGVVFQNCAANFKVYYISGKTGFTSTLNGYPVTTFVPLTTAPASLTLTSKTQTTAELSWSAVADATGYDVYNGTTKLATVLTTSYSVMGLSPGTNYNFTVRAVSDAMESPFTEPLSATTESMKGDANGNGDVDLMDVTALSRYVAGWTGVQVQEGALDVTDDGEVDLADVTLLSRYVAGWNVTIN